MGFLLAYLFGALLSAVPFFISFAVGTILVYRRGPERGLRAYAWGLAIVNLMFTFLMPAALLWSVPGSCLAFWLVSKTGPEKPTEAARDGDVWDAELGVRR